MKNPDTGVIFPYSADVMRVNKRMQECTEEGIPVGRPGNNLDELYAVIERLKKDVLEKDFRIKVLEDRLADAENNLIRQMGKADSRKRELEELKLNELRTLAADMGISGAGTKESIINAIVEAEENFAEETGE